MPSLSCCLSAAVICFLAVLFPPQVSASLTVRLPVARPPDCDGVSMFRTAEMRPVSGASFTPGPWCSHGCHLDFSHHCRLPAAGPFPRYCFHLPEFWVTKLAGVHFRSPFPVFPLPVASGSCSASVSALLLVTGLGAGPLLDERQHAAAGC